MKERRKIKIFGIGAAVLMIILAVTPTVCGIPPSPVSGTFPYVVDHIPSLDWDWNKIKSILETHQEEIDEINQYIEEFIDQHGCIDQNFSLPPDLQALFDSIINEIIEEIEAPYGSGNIEGGGNKNSFRSGWFYEPPYALGFWVDLYVDHMRTQQLDELADDEITIGDAFIILAAVILSAPIGGAVVGIIWLLAGKMIKKGIDNIIAKDEGYGIHIWWKHYFAAFPYQDEWICEPQSGGGGGGGSSSSVDDIVISMENEIIEMHGV